jgi:hypothetical protein
VRVFVAAALLLAAGSARADVAVRVVDAETPVLDGGVDNGGAPATVRIIGDTFVVVVHTSGQFSIDGLPPGIYRVETDRGRLFELVHFTGSLEDRRPICGDYPPRIQILTAAHLTPITPPAPRAPAPKPAAPRGHVATTSTTQGIRVDAAALRALP